MGSAEGGGGRVRFATILGLVMGAPRALAPSMLAWDAQSVHGPRTENGSGSETWIAMQEPLRPPQTVARSVAPWVARASAWMGLGSVALLCLYLMLATILVILVGLGFD